MLARDGESDHGAMAIANITIVRVATTSDAPLASSSRPSPTPLALPRPTSCARWLTTPGDYANSPPNSKPSRYSRSTTTSNPWPAAGAL